MNNLLRNIVIAPSKNVMSDTTETEWLKKRLSIDVVYNFDVVVRPQAQQTCECIDNWDMG